MLDRKQWRGIGFFGLAGLVGLAIATTAPDLAAQTPAAQLRATGRPSRLPSAYRIEVEGLPADTFTKFETIGQAAEVIEFQDGNDLFLRKRPGRAVTPDLVLTKPADTTPAALYDWWRQIEQGQDATRSIAVVLLNNAGQEIRRWTYHEAWPRAWEVTLGENGALVETIAFAVERVEIEL